MGNLDEAQRDHERALRSTVQRNRTEIDRLTSILVHAFRAGRKLLICGNGGSAADAQHFAAEFVNRMVVERPPLPAIALSTDTSVLTSIANDSAYDQVFARQVQGLGRNGDVLIGLSTSGGSANVLRALSVARDLSLVTIMFTGQSGALRLAGASDLVIVAASNETPGFRNATSSSTTSWPWRLSVVSLAATTTSLVSRL